MPRSPPTFKPSKPQTQTHRPKEADRQRTRALNTNSAEWKMIRQEILMRDGYRCVVCGRLGVGRETQVDHIDADDSNNDPANLQTLCASAHSRKTFAEQRGKQWDGICRIDRGDC